MPRIIVGISGASGMPLIKTMLKQFASVPSLELHLIISKGAIKVMQAEGNYKLKDFTKYAHTIHDESNMAAGPASGSWQHDGMLVCPCSMASLAFIANGNGTNLIHRAADVSLKERLPLIIVPRETPYNLIHLRNMQQLCTAGASIMPFNPAFYTKDTSLKGMMRHFAGRVLDQFKIEHKLCHRWQGKV